MAHSSSTITSRFLALVVTASLAACGGRSTDLEPVAGRDAWIAAHPLPSETFESYAIGRTKDVLFLGGITGVLGNIATAEPSRRVLRYDPFADAWTEGPELPLDAPKHHLTVARVDRTVYLLGGFDGILGRDGAPFTPVARAYALDDGASAWRSIADAPLARGGATAQAIGGRIYVTGGAPTEQKPPYADLDVYDPATNSWGHGPPMPTPREHLASCTIGGKMIVVGGWNMDVASHAAESFDPQTDSWTKLPDMPTARGGLAAIGYSGACHVLGGEDWAVPFPGTFHVHEAFDPTSGKWRSLASMPTARHGFGLARFDDALYAMGGGPSHGNSYTNVAEIYLP